jgi:hypothetical protein
MARITLYVVQAFTEEEGWLISAEPFDCATAEIALNWAQHLATTKAGVIAWAKRGAPDSDEWDESPEILFSAGRVPEAR